MFKCGELAQWDAEDCLLEWLGLRVYSSELAFRGVDTHSHISNLCLDGHSKGSGCKTEGWDLGLKTFD